MSHWNDEYFLLIEIELIKYYKLFSIFNQLRFLITHAPMYLQSMFALIQTRFMMRPPHGGRLSSQHHKVQSDYVCIKTQIQFVVISVIMPCGSRRAPLIANQQKNLNKAKRSELTSSWCGARDTIFKSIGLPTYTYICSDMSAQHILYSICGEQKTTTKTSRK